MQYTTTHQTSQSSNTYQDLRLHEWIDQGRASGRIRNVNTVLAAYCMGETEALAWIADIVQGRTTEETALVFMERALITHYH